MGGPTSLSADDAALLAFEHAWWLRGPKAFGYKAAEIRTTFGVSAARYQQRINRLLDDPVALAAQPMLVGRLCRLRAARRHAREVAINLPPQRRTAQS